jgi:hypothetical protein
MVSRKTLQKFIRKGGYEIVAEEKEGWEKWGLLTDNSRLRIETGLSKPVLISIKNQYPTKEQAEDYLLKRTHETRRVERFEETAAWRIIDRDLRIKKPTLTKPERTKDNMKRAYTYCHYVLAYKEPLDWTTEDIANLRIGNIESYDPKTFETRKKFWENKILDKHKVPPDIKYGVAVNLRQGFDVLGKPDLKAPLTKTQMRTPTKKEHYLREEQIISLLGGEDGKGVGINEIDTLMFFTIQTLGGARESSVYLVQRNDIKDVYIAMREPKLEAKGKAEVERFYDPKIIQLLIDYCNYAKIESGHLFKFQKRDFNKRLRRASKECGIFFLNLKGEKRLLTSHVLKHTFVTQASTHGWTSEAIEDQTGTEWRNLKLYYRGEHSQAAKLAVLGEKALGQISWKEWIDSTIYPAIKRRYDFLIAEGKQVIVNGIVRAEKPVVKKEPKRKTARKPRTLSQLKAAMEHGATQGLRDWAKRQIEEGNYRE